MDKIKVEDSNNDFLYSNLDWDTILGTVLDTSMYLPMINEEKPLRAEDYLAIKLTGFSDDIVEVSKK